MQPIKILFAIAALMFVVAPAAMAEEAFLNYKSYCMQCHGMHGKGDGVNVPAMNVRPRDHSDNNYMMTRTNSEIFKAIKFGGQAVNKSVKMPAWSDTFTDDEITQMVGHIRTLCCEKEIIRGVNFK
ncbi:MAG: cytochrome C class I [Zetaproteobacteria bacterium CG06_land_8_20_14_3_00_59_53]|nr:MAG: cytochrome C class I [Zetaproteobacteria bacterium CG2_30_59_37]PIO89785.1 MAG: cytochrome C class I [Zetaproteobacteria bacterium CG23_combo_of_CG06-09_8_20_14_all_59_86]PIQ64150.1 MAG: cytochrome C class I [Zetaproteobacteria bacterium CG11_big_fil_rev_8_21_14_0_20_59_439]PIU69971.1 MAG: cytochrome C class I [Zetaproteobacteria bacterium CG06_land_8_20_14_3_00_59_53]PIU96032.1 MAG: cytochrome C class I [Zetaproteobacteria bacterium CG03_land_8_20_14_0_80_59_51]PIY45782.1 MAG: cytochr